MSLYKDTVTILRCDKCGCRLAKREDLSIENMRRYTARAMNWSVVQMQSNNNPDETITIDVCPVCAGVKTEIKNYDY